MRALNTFFPLTYGLTSGNAADAAAELEQARHFGIAPAQLLLEPHPPRASALHVHPYVFNAVHDEVVARVRFPFNAPITFLAASTAAASASSTAANATLVAINANFVVANNKWTAGGPPPPPPPPASSQQHQQTAASTAAASPLVMDEKLAAASGAKGATPPTKLALELFSATSAATIVATSDCRFVFVAPFLDHSMRVFALESGAHVQTVYGHRAPGESPSPFFQYPLTFMLCVV